MEQTHGGGPGHFDPAQLDDGDWANAYIDASFNQEIYPFELSSALDENISNFTSDQTFGTYPAHYIPSDSPFDASGPASTQYSSRPASSSYHQPGLRFDLSHVQASSTPTGASQDASSGRGPSLDMAQHGYSQTIPDAQQTHWHSHTDAQLIHNYHGQPSYTDLSHQIPQQHQAPQSSQDLSQNLAQRAVQQQMQQPAQQSAQQPVRPPPSLALQQPLHPAAPQQVQPLARTAPVEGQASNGAAPVGLVENHPSQQSALHSATGSGLPTGRRMPVPDPYLRVDQTHLAEASDGPTPPTSWDVAKHLLIEPVPETRERIPKQQMIPVYLKSDKRRLFPKRSFSMPSESLGRHLEGYLSAIQDSKADPASAAAKRAQLNSILKHDLSRSGHAVPEKWHTKVETKVKEELRKYGQRDDSSTAQIAALPEDAVAEAERETIAVLNIPPGWQPDQVLLMKITEDFCRHLRVRLMQLRSSDAYKTLPRLIKENSREPTPARQEKIRTLRGELEPLRQVVERIVATALKLGDENVLRSINEVMNIAPLFQTTINCLNCDEPNAPLVKAVLRLFTHFTTLSHAKLEECKFFAARPKLYQQGDDDVKSSLAKIIAMAKDSKLKDEPPPAKPSSTAPATSKVAPTGMSVRPDKVLPKPTAGPSSISKRQRDDDSDSRTSKKLATGAKGPAPQAPVRAMVAKGGPTPPQQPSSATVAKSRPSTGLLPGKARPASKPAPGSDAARAEPAKPTAGDLPISGLPRPETTKPKAAPQSSASAAEPSRAVRPKRPEAPKAEAPQKSQLSFAALMAEIDKPKEVNSSTPTPTAPAEDIVETAEERARRLRKEERRKLKLRVSWKEGDQLAKVRVFHKEADEDEGRDVSMIRDAGGAEGNALKRGHSGQLFRWREPERLDLGHIPQEQREKNFVTRGGARAFRTEQQDLMEEREQKELMVIYTDFSDIPSTSRSPPPEPAQLEAPAGAEVLPPRDYRFDEIQKRVHDAKYLGPAEALRRLRQRNVDITLRPNETIIGKVLKRTQELVDMSNRRGELADEGRRQKRVKQLLTDPTTRDWKDPEPFDPDKMRTGRRHDYGDPGVQSAADAVEDVSESLKGKQAPAHEPPAWQKDPARREEWLRGLDQDQERAQQEAARQVAAGHAPPNIASMLGNYGNPAQASYILPQASYSQPQDVYAQVLAAAAQAAQHPGQQQQQQQQQHGLDPSGQVDPAQASLASLLQQPQSAFTQQQALDPSVQALLASLATQRQPTAAAAPPSGIPGMPGFQDTSQSEALLRLAQMVSGSQDQAGQHQPPGADMAAYASLLGQGGVGSNQRAGDNGYGLGQSYNQAQQQGEGADAGSRNWNRDRGDQGGRRAPASTSGQEDVPDHLRGINRALIGTKPCMFWARGTCAKGDKCTFRHD